uniref:Uncharacterized protein n=1 Tax=Anguilla anguilla TaxID=7936 RepID=A0A0E9RHQ2_ANGAN
MLTFTSSKPSKTIMSRQLKNT